MASAAKSSIAGTPGTHCTCARVTRQGVLAGLLDCRALASDLGEGFGDDFFLLSCGDPTASDILLRGGILGCLHVPVVLVLIVSCKGALASSDLSASAILTPSYVSAHQPGTGHDQAGLGGATPPCKDPYKSSCFLETCLERKFDLYVKRDR